MEEEHKEYTALKNKYAYNGKYGGLGDERVFKEKDVDKIVDICFKDGFSKGINFNK